MEPTDVTPPAQGQPGGAANAPVDGQPSGVEQRINEMHARLEKESAARQQAESAVLSMTAQMSELATQVMQMRQAPAAPVALEPVVEVDPEDARRIEAVAKRMYAPQLDQINKAIQQTQQMIGEMRTGFTQQKYSSIDPKIMQAATALAKQGFGSLENCIVFARGQAALAADEAAARGQAGRDNMTVRGTHTLPFQSAAPADGAPGGREQSRLPDNFDSLPHKEKMAILRKRGVENKPL